MREQHRRARWVAAIVAATSVLAAVSASGANAAKPAVKAGSGGSITILADTTREPAIKAFEKANPSIKVTIETYANTGNNGIEQKFALYNQAGSGWPDVFFSNGNDLAWASNSKINYTENLGSSVPESIQKGFGNNLSVCEVGGKLMCLPNDLGQVVLWYNATLFKQWGYSPPKTWQQYESLSLQIAKDHPGYFTGLAGDVNAPNRYLWPSGCPVSTLVAKMTVKINVNAPSCTRVENMLQTLLNAKVVSPIGLFDTDAPTQVGAKLVMTPGASWYGQFIFEADFKVPAHQITASLPLHWAGEKAGTGAEGGGLWMVSRHATGKNLAAAIKAVQFLTTNHKLLTSNVTFPAYGPAQNAWLAGLGRTGYFADFPQLKHALKTAASEIRTDTNWTQYNPGNIWSQTVTAALSSGQSLSSGWSTFGTQLVQQAQSFGYKVQK
ncbi:MAG TPA: extracellular solute-binding protein [Solirubrobacteraceae bacterium]|jgi:multiple sugar transport system substrate-binding protein|nr:extracellular solute-binding protein [Solirubrobacteraceae bacterium]